MKFLLLPATLALGLVAATPAAYAQAYSNQPSLPIISVSGSAEIKVVPDTVELHFEVKVRNRDFEMARKDEAARSAKVLAALRAAGVKEEDLRASQTQISTVYSGREEDAVTIRYYQVSQDFGCTLHDVAAVADVTAAAVGAGVTGVGEAEMRSSSLRKHRDEARRKAVIAAKEKAVALATELGAKVGRPNTITEGSYYVPSRASSNYISQNVQSSAQAEGTEENGGGSSFAPGMISISANVNVSFVLE